jgi:hypothetical protein
VFVLAYVALAGCYGPPRAETTYLRGSDLVEMTDLMARSFAAHPVMAARTEDDTPWVISIERVVNHTKQVIPERQKWLYLARLRALLERSDLAHQRALIWVIPPERWAMVAEETGASDEPSGLRLPPTHLLTATFGSLTNTSGGGRSDAYLCSFQLVDLSNARIVWEDRWEVKRSVIGVVYD